MSPNFSKLMLLTTLYVSAVVLADSPDTEMTQPNDKMTQTQKNRKVDRKSKGEMFAKMARCLNSDKSDAQCENELKGNCHRMGGMNRCGMGMMMGKMGQSMGNKMMGKGMGMGNMGGGMMNDSIDKGNAKGDSDSDKAMEPME